MEEHHLASLLPLHPGGDFQAQRVEADEAGGVVLVVGYGGVGFHRGDGGFVEADGGFAAGGHEVAFVELFAAQAKAVFLSAYFRKWLAGL